MPKILVGSDGSEPARHAVKWAIEVARLIDAKIELLYVVDLTAFADTPVFEDEALEHGSAILKKELEYSKSLDNAIEISGKVLCGSPAHVFEEASKEASLVVVGTHKGSHFTNIIFGSKPIRIAALSHAPVAVIPCVDLSENSGVVVALDESKESFKALYAAGEMAKNTSQKLKIITVANIYPTPPSADIVWSNELLEEMTITAQTALENAASEIKDKFEGVEIETYLGKSDITQEIIKHSKDAAALFIGSRGRRGLKRLLLGSVSHSVLANIKVPTIIIGAKND